jgi:hypothetical protein
MKAQTVKAQTVLSFRKYSVLIRNDCKTSSKCMLHAGMSKYLRVTCRKCVSLTEEIFLCKKEELEPGFEPGIFSLQVKCVATAPHELLEKMNHL